MGGGNRGKTKISPLHCIVLILCNTTLIKKRPRTLKFLATKIKQKIHPMYNLDFNYSLITLDFNNVQNK